MIVYKVLLPLNVPEPFDYISDLPLQRGDLVVVPFRGQPRVAVLWGRGEAAVADFKLKKIEEKLELAPLHEKLLKFVEWVAHYNMAGLGSVLKMVLPIKFGGRRAELAPQPFEFATTMLTQAQEAAAKALRGAVTAHKFSATLLDGVTGSGKTEVYFEAISAALEQGKQVLVLLPEIALSIQWIERFRARFGVEPCLWNSNLTPAQRRETWLNVHDGSAKLVVGARSALFLPFAKLALIVVDEEHDQSFKQEEGVTYHGRDMAVVRAKIEALPVVLVSATPAAETVHNVQIGKYAELKLPERFGGAGLPDIKAIDMRLEKLPANYFLSEPVRNQIAATIAAGAQAALFLNRRGFAPLTLCRACGHRIQCPNCSAWMVQHKRANNMQCHHCGTSSLIPQNCPACHEPDKLHACGPGVERLLAEARELFPSARVEVLSSDSPAAADEVIAKVMNHEIDVLIGTQIIAKGHHFPKLEFVGIVDADMGLEGGDLRAMERTYQLLHQVAGRAGREENLGRVLVQTYMPENSAIKALLSNDRDEFMANELRLRQQFGMPPYSRLATITISGKLEKQVKAAIIELTKLAPLAEGVELLGPAPAPMSFLRGKFRYRLIVKAKLNVNLQAFVQAWLSRQRLSSALTLKVDIDPYSFV